VSVIQSVLSAIKLRAALVFVVIHAGLVSAIYGVASLPKPNGMESSHWLALGGLAGVYGGMVLAVFLVVWPLASLVRRIRKLLRWRDWILDELPRIIKVLPEVLEAIRAFFQSLAKGGTVASAMKDASEQAERSPAVPSARPRTRSRKAA
jgi:hypothetical protein